MRRILAHLAEIGCDLLLLLNKGVQQTGRGLLQFRERLVDVALGLFNERLGISERLRVVELGHAELVAQIIHALFKLALRGIKVLERAFLGRLGDGGFRLVQFGFRLGHFIFRIAEVGSRSGDRVRRFLLQGAGVGPKFILAAGQFVQRRFLGLDRFLAGVDVDLLLFLDDGVQFLKHLLKGGEFLLRLLHLRDVLAQLLIGTLEGIQGGLLRGRIVLAGRERVLRLLHLGRRLADGLRGGGRLRAGLLLQFLRCIFQFALAWRFGGQIFWFRVGGFFLHLLLVLDQLAHLLLDLLEFLDGILGRLRELLGLGQFLHQRPARLLEVRNRFVLFRRRFFALFLRVAANTSYNTKPACEIAALPCTLRPTSASTRSSGRTQAAAIIFLRVPTLPSSSATLGGRSPSNRPTRIGVAALS